MSDSDLLRQRRDAAIAALDAGDFASAIRNALAAQALLATLPEVNKRSDQASIGWTQAEQIEMFIQNIRKQQNAACGIRESAVEYRSG